MVNVNSLALKIKTLRQYTCVLLIGCKNIKKYNMSGQQPTNVKALRSHFLQEQQRAQQVQRSAQNKHVGRFDSEKIAANLNEQFNTSQTRGNNENISRMEQARIDAMEQDAKEYEIEKKKQEYEMQSRHDKMKRAMEEEVIEIIGKSEWHKSKISRWMQEIIDSVGEVLDEFLSNVGVFKYAIDVAIIKSTAVARQSENLMSPKSDYSFNIKVKNGCGIIVLLNTHAFKVANI